MPIRTETNRNFGPRTIDEFPTTFGAGIGATFQQSVEEAPLLGLDLQFERLNERGGDQFIMEIVDASPMMRGGHIRRRFVGHIPEVPVLSVDEANERGRASGLTFTEDITVRAFDHLERLKQEELVRQSTIRRAKLPIPVTFGVNLVGQAIDPLNVATAFIPVLGEAKFAALFTSQLGRRAARGVLEGLQGAALVEPIVYANMTQKQADFTMADSLMNIGLGGVFGGGLHVAFGKLGDFRAQRREMRTRLESVENAAELLEVQTAIQDIELGNSARVEAMPHALREKALGAMLAQKIQGQLGDVIPIVNSSPEFKNPIDLPEAHRAANEQIDPDVAPRVEQAVGRSVDLADQQTLKGNTSERASKALEAPFVDQELVQLKQTVDDEVAVLTEEIKGLDLSEEILDTLGIRRTRETQVKGEVEPTVTLEIPELKAADQLIETAKTKAEAIRLIGECLVG